ncbi:hypothetical protein P6166_04780 [Stenotrophomonas sp. HITSZ_GD]|uniref:hypothetical protein n=1 Tax=Stenotrophomonas sp. HITSZ_GD TaxID=3037248 RepID=UPI00240DEEE2|nr:hypothetical protein [Stenotrophomonas sp. HITSZ_GD]MDG2524673.1 hypothetical protein [Stenotrophomonas sp. HITSZ_GD]
MLSRVELDRCLDTLQDQLPNLRSDEDADFDFLAFQAQADRIVASAAPEDIEHVRGRLQAMLEQAGLIPTDAEAERRR